MSNYSRTISTNKLENIDHNELYVDIECNKSPAANSFFDKILISNWNNSKIEKIYLPWAYSSAVWISFSVSSPEGENSRYKE